jgi:hypothetical protein
MRIAARFDALNRSDVGDYSREHLVF